MNTYFIQRYIKNLKKEDIPIIASKKGLTLNNTEIEKTYNYIKKNYQNYFSGKITKEDILKDAQDVFTEKNYQKFTKLYYEYKDKI